ncbi:MAG: 16S rRNA processing protein RimM [Deltaproteobacteria bacterium]|nr:16S rRNA processing protein RimM [Deltaproteobacteria bacterium]
MKYSNNEEYVPIGFLSGPHGIAGEVKLMPYADTLDFALEAVYLSLSGLWTRRVVNRARVHKSGYILALEGVKSRNEAETLRGIVAAIRKQELPEPADGEYYSFDVCGASVVTEDGRAIGTVTGIIHTGANDVLEVVGHDGEILIPAIENTIILFDAQNKKLIVRLMQGL